VTLYDLVGCRLGGNNGGEVIQRVTEEVAKAMLSRLWGRVIDVNDLHGDHVVLYNVKDEGVQCREGVVKAVVDEAVVYKGLVCVGEDFAGVSGV